MTCVCFRRATLLARGNFDGSGLLSRRSPRRRQRRRRFSSWQIFRRVIPLCDLCLGTRLCRGDGRESFAPLKGAEQSILLPPTSTSGHIPMSREETTRRARNRFGSSNLWVSWSIQRGPSFGGPIPSARPQGIKSSLTVAIVFWREVNGCLPHNGNAITIFHAGRHYRGRFEFAAAPQRLMRQLPRPPLFYSRFSRRRHQPISPLLIAPHPTITFFSASWPRMPDCGIRRSWN